MMRWRFTDRITRFDPWVAVDGRKTVSLEEYNLLEPFGRKGCLPESLIIESCVHLGRWLVMASSGFRETCVLSEIERFEFGRETTVGCALNMSVRVADTVGRDVRLACEVSDGAAVFGRGNLVVRREPLPEAAVAEDMQAMWRELHAKT